MATALPSSLPQAELVNLTRRSMALEMAQEVMRGKYAAKADDIVKYAARFEKYLKEGV